MFYSPKSLPPNADATALADFVERELATIAQVFNEQDFAYLRVQHAAPPKPRPGMIAFADGTDWNPGSGRGVYEYRSTSWFKL